MEHIREEQLALYAAGDLAPNETSPTAAHVQACETCQALVAGFRDVQDFVSSALLDPSGDELAEVRDHIRMKLRERRSWAGWAAAVAAATALVFIGIANKPITEPQQVPPVAQLKPLELPHLPIPQLQTAVLHTRHVRHRDAGIRSVDLIARADQPTLIKMTTADPNVVILWQSNEGVKNE